MDWLADSLRRGVAERPFDFSSRATRKEYFVLLGAYIATLFLLGQLFGDASPEEAVPGEHVVGIGISLVGWELLALPLSLPVWSCAVRRLLDAGYSAWVLLMGLIPLVGWIIVLYMLAEETKPYVNKWGLPPGSPAEQADLLDHLQS